MGYREWRARNEERLERPRWLVGFILASVVVSLMSLYLIDRAEGAETHRIDTCRPEPPDYPGCTRDQVLPYKRVEWRGMMTGHAAHYRYWRMGQRPRGELLSTISPKLDKHLARLWWAAYSKAKTEAADNGEPFRPAFRSWAAFRANMSAGCPSTIVGLAMPWAWCSAHASGYTDNDWRGALWAASKATIGCNGAVISWHMMTRPDEAIEMAAGRLRGGYWEPVMQTTACTAAVLFNKLFGFMGGVR